MRIGIFSDVHANIEAMNAVLDAFKSERIDKYVCIGDVVGYGASPNECCDIIRKTAAFTILGNHDADLPESIGGFICRSLTIGGVTLRHEPSFGRSAEIAGHLHPVARIARKGEVFRRKCFATDGHRLVMPAFGAYTGGLNLLNEAFSSLFRWHRLEAWLTGRTGVYPLQASLLLPD